MLFSTTALGIAIQNNVLAFITSKALGNKALK
jgi:hypothetical protein